MIAILPGLCEETLFRGVIQGTFEKKGIWKGIIYTAILFGAYHLNPWNFIPAVMLGILFGFITVRTNSIVPAMICHACNNGMAVIVAFIYREKTKTEPYLLVSVLTVLFVVVLAEFIYHTRHIKRQPSPLTIFSAYLSQQFEKIEKCVFFVIMAIILLTIVTFCVFFHGYHMTTDALLPEINRGDRVIVLENRYIDVDIQPGDMVAFKRDDHTMLRKVSRMDNDNVWIIEKTSETETSELPIPRNKLTGKIVYSLRIGK